jgi:pyroglutamyl-peptidase
MRHILLTGFEPFGGDSCNASAETVRRVEETWTGPHTLSTAILPVAFGLAAAELGALIDRITPNVIIAVGEAAGRRAITPERTAFNEIAAPFPDNEGRWPVGVPIVEGAVESRLTMLDVDSLIAAGRGAGIASEASDSAGRYVCNEVFYRLLEMLVGRAGVTGGFIHVPAVRGRDGELTVDALAIGLAAMAQDAANAHQ